MALIVEDGTNVANANALISVAYYTTYHTARANAIEADTAKLEAAIIRASQYIASFKFKGTPVNGRAQVFPFPMSGLTDAYGTAVDAASVPTEVIQATAEAAFMENATPGAFNPTANPADARIKVKTEKLDVLTDHTEYFGSGTAGTIDAPTSKRIMDLLSGLLSQSALGNNRLSTTQLTRA